MVEQTIRGDRIQNFVNVSYTMIHGMNDDNVHFKTSADMQKLLSKNDIEVVDKDQVSGGSSFKNI